MLLNPTDRFLLKKGRKEGMDDGRKEALGQFAKKLLDKRFPIEEIVELTGLSEEDVLKFR